VIHLHINPFVFTKAPDYEMRFVSEHLNLEFSAQNAPSHPGGVNRPLGTLFVLKFEFSTILAVH
jgi:hypothetical protein